MNSVKFVLEFSDEQFLSRTRCTGHTALRPCHIVMELSKCLNAAAAP